MMTIETIVMTIFNVGGILTMLAMFFFIIGKLISMGTSKIIGWTNKETRYLLIYFIRNRKKIKEVVDKLYKKGE